MATETDEESRQTIDDDDLPWCAPTTGDRRRKRIKLCANILFVASIVLLVLGILAYFVGVLGNWPVSIIALVFCFAACFMIISFLVLLWFSRPNPALNHQQETAVDRDVEMITTRNQLAEELDEFQLALAMSLSEKDVQVQWLNVDRPSNWQSTEQADSTVTLFQETDQKKTLGPFDYSFLRLSDYR